MSGRNKLRRLKDSMDINILDKCIDIYNETIRSEEHINKLMKTKKIRKSNFPSHISKNIILCHHGIQIRVI